MTRDIRIEPISAAAFAPFGDIIESSSVPTKIINGGMCARFSDCARLELLKTPATASLLPITVEPAPSPVYGRIACAHPVR